MSRKKKKTQTPIEISPLSESGRHHAQIITPRGEIGGSRESDKEALAQAKEMELQMAEDGKLAILRLDSRTVVVATHKRIREHVRNGANN